MREQSPGSSGGEWVPIREITDWRIGGPADREYTDPEQVAADVRSLLEPFVVSAEDDDSRQTGDPPDTAQS